MGNLDLYNKVREVPPEAQKTIGAGRLKGMTDINPMWRIKTLTEQFGACGVGWYTEVTKQWIEDCGEEKVACVNINLYVRVNDEWSKPIFGTGGSKLSTSESKGVYVSDECYKMAYTDAISVACKSLGMGADVYWNKDRTKYSAVTKEQQEEEAVKNALIDNAKKTVLIETIRKKGVEVSKVLERYNANTVDDMTVEAWMKAMNALKKMKDVV
jgi:hypothetical protein